MSTLPVLGRPARSLWLLREDASFLNHGSYGAVPVPVLEAQASLRAELERHPDAFMASIKPTGEPAAVRAVAAELATFTGTQTERLALVENATSGVQAVLNAMPLAQGDEILATDHQYNAVRLAIEARCRESGAVPRIVKLPLPIDAADIAGRVLAATGPRTRLAVLDHITSPSALRYPLEQLVPELQRRGIRVLVDGAHALGQVALSLDALAPDWCVSNAHKWLYAPRGSALLYAGAEAAPLTRPLQTSHYIDEGFPGAFDYVGTRDYTAWLSVPAALRFYRALDPAALASHAVRLVAIGTEALAASGALPASPQAEGLFMRAFVLPQTRAPRQEDADAVMRTLWERERIQIRCALAGGALLLRFCAQAYVDVDDMRRLGEALARHGWPDARR